MADSFIALDEPAVTDKKLDTEELTVGANTVQRERMQIAGTAATQIAPVSATDGLLVNLGANNDVTVTGTVAVTSADVATIAGAVRAEDVASADAHTGIVAMAVRKGTPANTSGTDGDYEMLQVSAGRLWVDASGKTLTVDGSAVTQPISVASVPSHPVTNAGTFAVQVDGAALTALQLLDNTILVDDAAFTPATSSVSMAGFEADESSTDSVDEGDAGAARMTLDRKLIVTPQPHTAGGCTIFRSLDLDESEEEVKATAGCVYSVWFTNRATTTIWLKFYNATAANVTVGSTTPVITLGLPGNTSDDISGNLGPGGVGIAFDTAISVACTTGFADADTGAPAANDVLINIFYK